MTERRLEYDSPVSFSAKQKLILATAPFAAATVLKLIYGSARKENLDAERFERAEAGGHFLTGLWHETLALVACRFRGTGYHTLTSYSFDGELATRAVNQFGLHAVRGSSSRGGVKALAQLALATESVRMVGLTLDGPRGPRRIAKPGMAYLAVRTQLPVIVVAACAHPSWRLNSWDQFQIPKPFGRIRFAFSELMTPPETTNEVEPFRVQMESTLNDLHEKIEALR